MQRIVVDTNVLVSFVTDRDESQQEQAARFFEAAASGQHEVILHQAVVTEMVYVLGNLYQLSQDVVAEVVGDLLMMRGVRTADAVPWQAVLDLWPSRYRDFGDAILAAVVQSERAGFVATFDQSFQKQLRRDGVEIWSSA